MTALRKFFFTLSAIALSLSATAARAGLAAGDSVVVKSSASLADGETVAIQK